MKSDIFKLFLCLLGGIFTGVTSTVFALDSRYDDRYVSSQQFESFYSDYSFEQRMRIKAKIRKIKRQLEEDPNNEDLQEDLNLYLDQFCDGETGASEALCQQG